MAYLDYTKRNRLTAAELTLCLTVEECKLILPLIRKAWQKAEKRYLKYEDIHQSGCATKAQEDRFLCAEEAYNQLTDIEAEAATFVKKMSR